MINGFVFIKRENDSIKSKFIHNFLWFKHDQLFMLPIQLFHWSFCLNLINIAVILSVPIPSSEVTAHISSNIFSTGGHILFSYGFNYTILSFIFCTHSWLDKQSQIPSHATIKNDSFPSLFTSIKSGYAVTA